MRRFTMPDDEGTQAASDEASDRVATKRLVTLSSTEGRTPQEVAAEIMANWRKYKKASE
jgi:hypothetical protein